MLCWVLRLALSQRPTLYRTPVDYALLGFFILTGISSFLSYEPFVSIGKLRAASLFTIVYLFAENVRSRRVLRVLAVTLIASCMINVAYTVFHNACERGVRIQGVAEHSPLWNAGLWEDDTLLEADGRPLNSLQEFVNALSNSPKLTVHVKVYRFEFLKFFDVPRDVLQAGATPEERLSIKGWSRGHGVRATGFYGHYTTYAEALQLIASLALGLFIALSRKQSLNGALLTIALAGLAFALLLTVTRASWLAFLVSAILIVVAGASRRTMLILAACLVPLILAGLFVLQRTRRVGFFDQKDASVTWRETVWREGFHLLVSKPRHLLVGVGMDSIKRHWRAWGLFDNGNIPVGHMHSTPLQIALERGFPALVVWLIWLGIYARTLWRLARSDEVGGWIEKGIVLGALGGLAGFFTSGLVHYNFGDSEDAMIFYFIMGLALVVERETRRKRMS